MKVIFYIISLLLFFSFPIEGYCSCDQVLGVKENLKQNSKRVTKNSWTGEEVLRAIQALQMANRPLNSRSMLLNQGGEESDRVVSEVTNRSIKASAVYAQAIKIFGGWSSALEAAGIDVQQVRKQATWTPSLVLECIVVLEEAQLDMSAVRVQSLYPEANSILQQHIGQAVTTQALYDRARYYYKDWYKALEMAGVDYKKHKRKFNWSREKIIESLQILSAAGLRLTPIRFQQNDPIYLYTLSHHFQMLVRPSPLYELTIKKYFNSWSDALLASGFDPNEEYLKLPKASRFSKDEADVTVEVSYDSDGNSVRQVRFGQADISPEEDLIMRDQQVQAQRILEKSLNLSSISADILLEVMDDSDLDSSSFDDIASRLSEKSGILFTTKDLEDLFKKLATSEELKALMD